MQYIYDITLGHRRLQKKRKEACHQALSSLRLTRQRQRQLYARLKPLSQQGSGLSQQGKGLYSEKANHGKLGIKNVTSHGEKRIAMATQATIDAFEASRQQEATPHLTGLISPKVSVQWVVFLIKHFYPGGYIELQVQEELPLTDYLAQIKKQKKCSSLARQVGLNK